MEECRAEVRGSTFEVRTQPHMPMTRKALVVASGWRRAEDPYGMIDIGQGASGFEKLYEVVDAGR